MVNGLIALAGSAVALLLGGRFVYRSVSSAARQRRLKEERRGYDVENFVAELGEDGIDEELARSVFHCLQGQVATRDFPVMPDDPLVAMFGIDRWGGVELIEVLEELDESTPWEERLRGEVAGLVTVRDLARLVAENGRPRSKKEAARER